DFHQGLLTVALLWLIRGVMAQYLQQVLILAPGSFTSNPNCVTRFGGMTMARSSSLSSSPQVLTKFKFPSALRLGSEAIINDSLRQRLGPQGLNANDDDDAGFQLFPSHFVIALQGTTTDT